MTRALAMALAMISVLGVAIAFGQGQAPKPGPELKKLEYFVGTWSSEGEMKPGPLGPGGKFTGTDRIEWMDGGFFLVGHGEGDSSMGHEKGMAFWGYDTENKVYTYHAFNSMGEAISATGTPEGDSWTWTNEEKMGGKLMKGRYSIKELSPTSYTFKLEMQPEGGAWGTVMEGKATKK
jgi:Protein of unknown function (DUF1579)